MGLADLHIHTMYSSDGTSSVSAVLKHVAKNTDLDVIAITDHDNMDGIQEAMDLAPAYGIEVVPGCEVTTADGHLLALFIHKLIPSGLSLLNTIELIGEQGGICAAAHPMAQGVHSLSFLKIKQALENEYARRVFVGIEAYNSGLVYTARNALVEAVSRKLPLAQLGNSDSHILQTIGWGASEFQGCTSQDLRAALMQARTRVRKVHSPDGLGVLLSYLPRYFLRKLGWVAYNAHPQLPLTLARLGRISNHPVAIQIH